MLVGLASGYADCAQRFREYHVVYPTGETETILSVPHYSFSWQLSYYPVKPIVLTKGTKIGVYGALRHLAQ